MHTHVTGTAKLFAVEIVECESIFFFLRGRHIRMCRLHRTTYIENLRSVIPILYCVTNVTINV